MATTGEDGPPYGSRPCSPLRVPLVTEALKARE